jgi:hypothetical protein
MLTFLTTAVAGNAATVAVHAPPPAIAGSELALELLLLRVLALRMRLVAGSTVVVTSSPVLSPTARYRRPTPPSLFV